MGKKKEKGKREKKGRKPCCETEGVRRGVWTPEEDRILIDFITENGHGAWRDLPPKAGLLRCGKSSRLRWTNYLRPDIKCGPFSPLEENIIIHLQAMLGNKWAAIASSLPGRTDNDIKNFWNSHLKKRFSNVGSTFSPPPEAIMISESASQWENIRFRLSSSSACTSDQGNCFIRKLNSDAGKSFLSIEQNEQDLNYKTEAEVTMTACSDSLKSYEIDDSPDAMLKLLLGFLAGEDDASLHIQDR